MSYGVMPYVVNVDKIVNAIKSDDTKIKEELAARCETEILETIKFEPDSEDFIRNAMTELIHNKIQDNPEVAAEYWYHLKQIIENDEFGMEVNREWYPCDPEIFYSVADLYYFGELDLPQPDDFPVVFTIMNESLPNLLTNLDTYVSEKYSKKAIDEFKSWIDKALRNGCDLVMYYH